MTADLSKPARGPRERSVLLQGHRLHAHEAGPAGVPPSAKTLRVLTQKCQEEFSKAQSGLSADTKRSQQKQSLDWAPEDITF